MLDGAGLGDTNTTVPSMARSLDGSVPGCADLGEQASIFRSAFGRVCSRPQCCPMPYRVRDSICHALRCRGHPDRWRVGVDITGVNCRGQYLLDKIAGQSHMKNPVGGSPQRNPFLRAKERTDAGSSALRHPRSELITPPPQEVEPAFNNRKLHMRLPGFGAQMALGTD